MQDQICNKDHFAWSHQKWDYWGFCFTNRTLSGGLNYTAADIAFSLKVHLLVKRTSNSERASTPHCCSTVHKRFSVSCTRFGKAKRSKLFDRTVEHRNQSASYRRFLVWRRDKYHLCRSFKIYTAKEIDRSVRYSDSKQNLTLLDTFPSFACGKAKRKKCYW